MLAFQGFSYVCICLICICVCYLLLFCEKQLKCCLCIQDVLHFVRELKTMDSRVVDVREYIFIALFITRLLLSSDYDDEH